MEPAIVFTIGHSTRQIQQFAETLIAHGIKEIADIRTIPKSRHNPQFNEDTLRKSLKAAKIKYVHMKGLGGLRHALKASVNTAWRNSSFRGFADYMQTTKFEESLNELIEAAKKQVTAIMCAEAVPWRCHRSLIGDALLIRGIRVVHIISAGSIREHVLTPWAKVDGTRIIYPEE